MKNQGARRTRRHHGWLLTAAALAATGAAHAQQAERLLNQTLSEQARVDTESQLAQARVESLAEEVNELLADYRVAVQQLDRLQIYNGNLERLVADQEAEKRSIAKQLEEFGDVEKGIVPLMYRLIDDLETFVELDMPFARSERSDRVQRLRRNMERSDLTVSEKYRQIMEAYQIETGYGRTIEAYKGSLAVNGEERTVDLLRIGRIVLAYQTPDRSITGIWDKQRGEWTEVDGDYRRAVTDGLRIAQKQAAPDLLTLPLPAAEAAR
ncbi:MAG: DUF3450 domain-containing protein [Woeseiaceae bacterium]|nr:DUF3450 domain-containing protein [Woeseiaceae bacterium]